MSATVSQLGVVLSRHHIESRLALPRDARSLIAQVEQIYAAVARQFSVDMAEAIAEGFDQALGALPAQERAAFLAWASMSRADRAPVPLWVRARLLGLLGETQQAAAAWDACMAALPRVEVEALLHRTRARAAAGIMAGALADLRLALEQPTGYEFWQRAEPVLQRLTENHPPPCRRKLKIAVLSGKASISLFVPMLRLACFRDGIDATLYASDYDALSSEVLDASSRLYAFRPDVVIFATHWRDAELPPFVAADAQAQEVVEQVVARFTGLWATLGARHRCTIVMQGFDRPFRDPYGRLSTDLPGGRGSLLRRIDARLSEAAAAGVILLDLDAVAAAAGADVWEEPRQWHLAKLHPGTGGLGALVQAHAAVLRAIAGLTKKVLVFDLDNVLWGGVIGEDGLEGIQLGAPSASGEGFQELQRYAKRLQERGVLLAVCSKNNAAEARAPFESHPETVLRPEDFVAFIANWEDKATNLRRLSDTLALGLESFVFVDDNPAERQWVRSQLPEVSVVELPADPTLYVDALDRGRYFEAIALVSEDRARHQLYRGNVERQTLQAAASSLQEFLHQLGMVATSGPFDAANLQRIAQLVNKTNQFNLTTRRYTETQLATQAADPAWWTRWFRLTDRYGDHGLVGVLTLKPRLGDADAMEIDNWVISCRVLGRRLEAFMLRQTLEFCRERGVKRIYASYAPTSKNAPVADLLPRLGFAAPAGGRSESVVEVDRAVLSEIPISTGGARAPAAFPSAGAGPA